MKPAEYNSLLPRKDEPIDCVIIFNGDLNNPDYTIQAIPDGIRRGPSFYEPNTPTTIILNVNRLMRYHQIYLNYDMAIPTLIDIMALLHIIKTAVSTNHADAIDEAIYGDPEILKRELTDYYSDFVLGYIVYEDFNVRSNPISLVDLVGDRFVDTMSIAYKDCHQFLTSRGYIYRYYIYVSETNLMVQANMGKLPMTPQSFEVFAPMQRFKHMDASSLGGFILRVPVRGKLTPSILGWKKADMFRAINEAGVRRPMLYRPGGNERNTPYMANVIPKEVVGVENVSNNPFTRYLPGMPDIQVDDPDFNVSRLYGNRAYYSEVYRRIYKTQTYFDWDNMCKYRPGYVGANKESLKLEFNLDNADFENEAEACKLIAERVKAKKKFVEQIGSALPFASEAIKFPAESRWVTENVDPETLRQFYQSPIPKSAFEQKIILERWCGDDSVSKEDYIKGIKGIRLGYLLPANLEPYSKNQLCEYILDIITRETEKYGFIELDCRDPSIQKRHILNAMTIMGLGEVFKNIDYLNITKEELCEKVVAYITILREQSALKFAADTRPGDFIPDLLE